MKRLRTQMLVAASVGLLLILSSGVSLGLWLQQDTASRDRARQHTQLLAAQAELESTLGADLALRAAWIASDNASVAYIADALALASAGQPVDVASISDLLGERLEELKPVQAAVGGLIAIATPLDTILAAHARAGGGAAGRYAAH